MKIVVAWLTVATLCALDATPTAAQDYPFCLQGGDFGSGYCSFTSYQQCQASASGRDAWCQANPYFRATNDMQRPARSARKRS